MIKKWITSFNEATGETKQFVLTIALILGLIFATVIYSYLRLPGDRSYAPQRPPASKIQAR